MYDKQPPLPVTPPPSSSVASSGYINNCDSTNNNNNSNNYIEDDEVPPLPATPPPVLRSTSQISQPAGALAAGATSPAVLQKSLSGDLLRPVLSMPPPVLYGGGYNRDSYYSTVSSTGSPIVEEPPSPAPSQYQQQYAPFPEDDLTYDNIIEVRSATTTATTTQANVCQTTQFELARAHKHSSFALPHLTMFAIICSVGFEMHPFLCFLFHLEVYSYCCASFNLCVCVLFVLHV